MRDVEVERMSMFIINKVETSHILISIRLYLTFLTISITEDGPQPGKNERLNEIVL